MCRAIICVSPSPSDAGVGRGYICETLKSYSPFRLPFLTMSKPAVSLSLCAFLGVLLLAQPCSSAPRPLINAHAHNDYEHPRPLLDALDHGFCSVEADIYLVEGQLLVAHDRGDVSKERTLQALYLDPLLARVKKNQGAVYPQGPEFTLLIDIKSNAEETYAVLREVLKKYSEMLTVFRPDKTEPHAVTIILSGNRPKATVAGEALRHVSIDGRLTDLAGTDSRHLIPLISDNWANHFQWRGVGPLPEDEKTKLKRMVEQAHQSGRRIRFWAAPDTLAVWGEFQAAGVDLLNTDSLAGLQRFLRQRTGRAQPQR